MGSLGVGPLCNFVGLIGGRNDLELREIKARRRMAAPQSSSKAARQVPAYRARAQMKQNSTDTEQRVVATHTSS